VVLGAIPADRKIDATNLVILSLAGLLAILMVNPDALERLKRLKLAGFELDLEKLKQKQEEQQSQLKAISLLLPMLVREQQAKHLRNLAGSRTAGYVGSHDLRTELRSLATMGLIYRQPGRLVREMKDAMNFNLVEYVQLSEFGGRIVAQLVEMDKAKAEKEAD